LAKSRRRSGNSRECSGSKSVGAVKPSARFLIKACAAASYPQDKIRRPRSCKRIYITAQELNTGIQNFHVRFRSLWLLISCARVSKKVLWKRPPDVRQLITARGADRAAGLSTLFVHGFRFGVPTSRRVLQRFADLDRRERYSPDGPPGGSPRLTPLAFCEQLGRKYTWWQMRYSFP
jgi:hypothetical protein